MIEEVYEVKYDEEQVRERRVSITRPPDRVCIPGLTRSALEKQSVQNTQYLIEDIENCHRKIKLQYKLNQNMMPKPENSGRGRRLAKLKRETEIGQNSKNATERARIETRKDRNQKQTLEADDLENVASMNNQIEN